MLVYFVTFNAFMRKHLLQSHRMAKLIIEVLLSCRDQKRYLLHEFVVMPNHAHVIISLIAPNNLEGCIQRIKGTAWGRARREFNFHGPIWQHRFNDHRIRDFNEYAAYRTYLHQNPVKRGLVANPEQHEYGSASGKYVLDPAPKEITRFFSATGGKPRG